MNEYEKRDVLAGINPFGACSDRQLDDFARLAGELDLQAGDVLCRQGEAGSGDTYVIVVGMLCVTIDGAPVATLGAGDIVGEQALFHCGRRNATVTAMNAAKLLVIDPREIDSMLAAVPSAAVGYGVR